MKNTEVKIKHTQSKDEIKMITFQKWEILEIKMKINKR